MVFTVQLHYILLIHVWRGELLRIRRAFSPEMEREMLDVILVVIFNLYNASLPFCYSIILNFHLIQRKHANYVSVKDSHSGVLPSPIIYFSLSTNFLLWHDFYIGKITICIHIWLTNRFNLNCISTKYVQLAFVHSDVIVNYDLAKTQMYERTKIM